MMVSWAVFGAFGGAGPFGIGVAGPPGRCVEGTGGDPRAGLEALEAGDLVFELVDALFELLDASLLEGDDVEQLPHQGRAFGLRDVGQQDPHDQIRPATSRPIGPGLLRSYRCPTKKGPADRSPTGPCLSAMQ